MRLAVNSSHLRQDAQHRQSEFVQLADEVGFITFEAVTCGSHAIPNDVNLVVKVSLAVRLDVRLQLFEDLLTVDANFETLGVVDAEEAAVVNIQVRAFGHGFADPGRSNVLAKHLIDELALADAALAKHCEVEAAHVVLLFFEGLGECFVKPHIGEFFSSLNRVRVQLLGNLARGARCVLLFPDAHTFILPDPTDTSALLDTYATDTPEATPRLVHPWEAVLVTLNGTIRSQTLILLVATLVVYSAQGLLVPVLAPVTRLVGLKEVDLGAVMTLAAAMLVFTAGWWGREVDRIGVHAVLVRGLVLATVGTVGFALMTELASRQDLPRWLVVSVFALTRGVIYGLGMAAVPVAALTYFASVTEGTEARTKAMGAFGAMQGISLVVGPALGGAFAMITLLMPIYIAPALMVATLFAVLSLRSPEHQQREETVQLAWGDKRVLPYLIVGGFLFLGLALVEIIMGFLVQDRLGLSDEDTAVTVATAGVLIGLGFAATQGLLAPRVPGGPRALMALGSLCAAAGYGFAMAVSSLPLLLAAMLAVAVGLGLALPGYNAGATLAVDPSEHAGVAGRLAATVGLTYMVGPVLGAGLYSMNPFAPLIGAGLLSLIAAGLAAGKLQSSSAAGRNPDGA